MGIHFDHSNDEALFPLTLTRSALELRIGILTIAEKWKILLGYTPEDHSSSIDITPIPAATIPTTELATAIKSNTGIVEALSSCTVLTRPWHLFQFNDQALRNDFALITARRKSAPIPETVMIRGSDLFIEQGARLSHCVINTETGPVYIGADAEVMEGAVIRGPFALGRGATVKMGATIYGATTVGPFCVAGGEIKNSILMGYSNKAHHGYLGDSVVGEWCNFGAGTSVSNIKNNASKVRVWDNHQREYIDSGLQKCGLITGDYSRAAINTSFNTGTVIGVCANIFGAGLMPKYIPSFSWGGDSALRYDPEKAMQDIGNWKKMKNASLTEQEKKRLKLIFDQI